MEALVINFTGCGRERKEIDKLITLHLKTRRFYKVSGSLVKATMISQILEPLQLYVFVASHLAIDTGEGMECAGLQLKIYDS